MTADLTAARSAGMNALVAGGFDYYELNARYAAEVTDVVLAAVVPVIKAAARGGGDGVAPTATEWGVTIDGGERVAGWYTSREQAERGLRTWVESAPGRTARLRVRDVTPWREVTP